MAFGPPLVLLVAGVIGSAYIYAVFAGIRAHTSGEPEWSELVE